MRNSFIIAKRELNERLRSRSFVLMAVFGPILLLFLLFLLLNASDSDKKEFNVLVADPIQLLENKIKKDTASGIDYSFINRYVEPSDFVQQKIFKSFDAVLIVNEKVLSNNHAFLYLKTKLPSKVTYQLQREFERRLEELKVAEFTDLSMEKYWMVKNPVSIEVRDAYHPHEIGNYKLAGYTGFAFGALIFVFVFLFGMTILRSTNREKSGRIAEIILSSIRPREFMIGKVLGIGLAALMQFLVWIVLIGVGLAFLRHFFFPDLLDASNIQLTENTVYVPYNELVNLVFERIDFVSMLSLFATLLVLGYLFYGALFAALGAAQGSASDGQQFLIPLIGLLIAGLWSGYYVVENPDATLSFYLEMLPFTSPMCVMVKFAQGYPAGESWHLYLSFLFLLVGIILHFIVAGRLFRKGLLAHGYQLRWRQLMKFLKSS